MSETTDRERRGDLLDTTAYQGPRGSSTWQSLHRGAGTIETDYLNGEIARLARAHGIPAPLNSAVQRAARRVVRDRLQPRTLDADALLSGAMS